MINQNNPLPKFLVNRYRNWKANEYLKNINLFKQLSKGQNPKAMIISCCDSRVHANSIFGAKEGDFFIHRNIANLIPPYTPDGDYHGTSAAIEYGIRELKVPHMIVLGHTGCGGVKSAHKLYTNKKNNDYVFINKWLGIMSPAFNKIPKNKFVKDQIKILEEESIKISINNLFDFPYIKDMLKNNQLSIHGLIHNIGSGELKYLNFLTNKFENI
jgi:carbonic anhydrase